MTPQRIVGIVILVVGVVILFFGVNASHSVGDQLSNTFTGRFTGTTMWYILGGLAAALCGLMMAVVGVKTKT
jgi:drug/metabolite transporter (DMT)-like permease